MTTTIKHLAKYQPEDKVSVITAPYDEGLSVPDDGYSYVQTLHDGEYLGEPRQKKHHVNYSVPAVMNDTRLMAPNDDSIPVKYRGRVYDYVDMPPQWQWFLFDLWRAYALGPIPDGEWTGTREDPWKREEVIALDTYTPGSAKWMYEFMIEVSRSHTDDRPVEKGWRDDVLKRYMDAPGPYSWLFRTTTGNIHRVIRREYKCLVCEAIDIRKPVPSIESLRGKHHLIHFATNQEPYRLPNKKYAVTRYPAVNAVNRLNGYLDSGTPIPVLSLNGEVMILEARTRKMRPGQGFSMYEPGK
jgi:hypothetical protein